MQMVFRQKRKNTAVYQELDQLEQNRGLLAVARPKLNF